MSSKKLPGKTTPMPFFPTRIKPQPPVKPPPELIPRRVGDQPVEPKKPSRPGK